MNLKKYLAAITVAAALCASAVTHVDVLVSCDTTAAQWLTHNNTTLQAFAEGQIANANEVLANSGLSGLFDFRLAGVYQAGFTHNSSSSRLVNTRSSVTEGGGDWAALRSERDSLGADIAVVLVDSGKTSGQLGVSNGLEPYVNGKREYGLEFQAAAEYLEWFAERAFCVVEIGKAAEDYTFVHELGHVMGAGHSQIISEDYDEPGPQLYEYSAAWMVQGGDDNYYSTIMGYSSTGYADSPEYTILPYFSSPNLKNPATGEPLGSSTNDNVRTLRNTYQAVANFRTAGGSGDGGGAQAIFAEKKTTISAVLKDGQDVAGIAEFVVAATRKGTSKVTATFIGLDGKKKKAKNAKWEVYGTGDGVAHVSLSGVAVKGFDGTLSVILGSDGSLANGSLGGLTIEPASIGVSSSSGYFWIDSRLPALEGAAAVEEVAYEGNAYNALPYSSSPEAVAFGSRWSVAKASRLKLVRDRASGATSLVPSGSANLEGLRLTYKAKMGTFKGSFTAYAVNDAGKLKKYKFNVTGVVADDVGTGIAVCKKLRLEIPVSVGTSIPVCGECTVSASGDSEK